MTAGFFLARRVAKSIPARPELAPLERLLQACKSNRLVALLLMVPNLIGIVFGYYYYWEVGQFSRASFTIGHTSWWPSFPQSPHPDFFRHLWWWPFIPDSPNAVVLMSAALLWYAFLRRRSRILDGLAFTSMVYVGCWTVFLFLAYPADLHTFVWGSTNNLLLFSHMGMPLEALILIPDLRRDVTPWTVGLGITAWNALNLWLDYWGPHLHPAPFLHSTVTCSGPMPPAWSPCDRLLHEVSPWLMVGALALWWWMAKPWKPRPRGAPERA
ncbi:MAG: DUF1405 domain-containing protein [Thermoplasmatota archaeon]